MSDTVDCEVWMMILKTYFYWLAYKLTHELTRDIYRECVLLNW